MRARSRATRIALLAATLTTGALVGRGFYLAVDAQHGQHGQAPDPQAHFQKVAERLELTAAQREKLAEPFQKAFAAMTELHRQHSLIEAELTEAQKSELSEMIHEVLGSAHESGAHR